jgi:hypothetical protein
MKRLDAPRSVRKHGTSWLTTVPREALGPLTQANDVVAEWKYDFNSQKWTVRFRLA